MTATKPARMGRPPIPADQQARVPYTADYVFFVGA